MFPAGAAARDIDVLYVGKFADVKGARALLSERYAGLRRVALADSSSGRGPAGHPQTQGPRQKAL